jgi:hypothetical protein
MFVTCFLYGGLGNQLFQIFTTIAYSLKHNIQLKFIYTENLGKRPVYWGSLLSGLSSYLSTDIDIDALQKIKQPSGTIIDAPKNNSVILDGYFQSPHFFDSYYSDILTICGIRKIQEDIYYGFNAKYDNNTYISMHFRRGDYKEIQHIHPIMPLEYYENALAYTTAVLSKDKYIVLYFCEDEDAEEIKMNDIVKLQKTFTNCEFRRFVGSSDWEEMLYMSCCDANIIANSSFSWWGAYMNRSGDTICYPGKWFGKDPFPKIMFPDNWIKISWI